jgi:uncharacterized protein (TIGR02421 family)
LSDRLVAAQRPIRILDAIKWADGVEEAFFAKRAKELPPVTADYYAKRPLPFNPDRKRQEFHAIERDIRRRLGPNDAAGQIMTRMCAEYRDVVDLLVARGTRAFSPLSQRLYGSTADTCLAGVSTVSDLRRMMSAILDNLAPVTVFDGDEETLDAAETVAELSRRLAAFFRDPTAVRVRLSDGIVADAAAGTDYIKIRSDARFSPRDVRLLEVHEGWVHLGTAINGQNQPICTFLGKGPPSSTLTQEGLAVLTEIMSFASHPARVHRLTNRMAAVALAQAGANFLEVYRFFLQGDYPPREAYQHSMRVFRGSLPADYGPFTKDLCYAKGFQQVHSFMRLAVTRGMVRRVPLLFCGKTRLADVGTIAQLAEEGLVAPPRYVPPPFMDLHALSASLCKAESHSGPSTTCIEQNYEPEA